MSFRDRGHMAPHNGKDIKVDSPKQHQAMAVRCLKSAAGAMGDADPMFNTMITAAEAYAYMTIIDPQYSDDAAQWLVKAQKRLVLSSAHAKPDQVALGWLKLARGWAFLAAIGKGFSLAGAVQQMALAFEFDFSEKKEEPEKPVDMYQEGDWS